MTAPTPAPLNLSRANKGTRDKDPLASSPEKASAGMGAPRDAQRGRIGTERCADKGH